MPGSRRIKQLRIGSGIAFGLIASAVIWSKLRLVGDVPRRVYAEPEPALQPPEADPDADRQDHSDDADDAPDEPGSRLQLGSVNPPARG